MRGRMSGRLRWPGTGRAPGLQDWTSQTGRVPGQPERGGHPRGRSFPNYCLPPRRSATSPDFCIERIDWAVGGRCKFNGLQAGQVTWE